MRFLCTQLCGLGTCNITRSVNVIRELSSGPPRIENNRERERERELEKDRKSER